jgi:hypothetical protein
MKADTIVAMLSDPSIDPTSWVGEALVEWVGKNITRCLEDTVARDYLFRGMDSEDLKTVVSGVIPLYKEHQDSTIVKKFIDGCNNITSAKKTDDYGHKWAMEKVARELNEIAGPNTVDHIAQLQMPGGDNQWYGPLVEHMKDYHVTQVLRNRLLQWGPGGFTGLLDLTPDHRVFDLFLNDIWEKHLFIARGQDTPKQVQKILYHLFLRLPGDQAVQWLKWLEGTEVQRLWNSTEGIISKARDTTVIKFEETVCRCGTVTKSRSGSTLHRKKCGEGSELNLYLAAKILVADNTSQLICNKCGKTCKSQPGLALHQKKCASEMGDEVRKNRIDLQQRILLRNTNNVD